MDLKHVFTCGHPALDFAATLRARRTLRFEMFASPDRLDAWYVESGLVDTVTPAGTPEDVTAARSVREALYALLAARRENAPYPPPALRTLNAAAAHPAAVPRLTPEGRATRATPAEALATLARTAVDLLTGPDVPLLKECANPECTRLYVDRSHGMRRHWCGMESCGNRVKAAAYRARKAAKAGA